MLGESSKKSITIFQCIQALLLVCVLILTFLVGSSVVNLQALGASDTSAVTEAHIQIRGKEIWSGEVPEEGLYPLTTLAWALGYFVQEIPGNPNSAIRIKGPGELSEDPRDGLIMVNANPGDRSFYFAFVYQLYPTMKDGEEVAPNLTARYLVALAELGNPMELLAPDMPMGTKTFEQAPVLKDGELYLRAEDLVPIAKGEYEENESTLNFLEVSFNNYVEDVWQPGDYTQDEFERAVEESVYELMPFFELVHNPELLADYLTVFANLSQGEGFVKPSNASEYIEAATQVIANDYASQDEEASQDKEASQDEDSSQSEDVSKTEDGSKNDAPPQEVSLEEAVRCVEKTFSFYVLSDDLSSLPDTLELPEGHAGERVYADEIVKSQESNYLWIATYTNPVNGVREEALLELEVGFDPDSLERWNQLILHEIKVLEE